MEVVFSFFFLSFFFILFNNFYVNIFCSQGKCLEYEYLNMRILKTWSLFEYSHCSPEWPWPRLLFFPVLLLPCLWLMFCCLSKDVSENAIKNSELVSFVQSHDFRNLTMSFQLSAKILISLNEWCLFSMAILPCISLLIQLLGK